MKKLHWMLVMLMIGTLILTACGGGPAAAPSGGGAPAPSGSSSGTKAAPPPQPPPAQPTAEKPASDTNLLDLKDVTEGLASLDSHKSTFTMSFDGTEDGQPKSWNWSMVEEFSKNPPAKRNTMSGMGTDTTGKDTTIQSIEVGGKSYSMFGNTCVSADAKDAPTASSSFTPSSVIGDIRGTQLLGTENVNGVPAQHFAVDIGRYATLGEFTNAKSEVWVAQPGNYVVKYTFEATGKDTIFGAGKKTEGTLRWVYEVNSVNQPLNITAPENCGGAPKDIPLMADATDQSSFGTMSTYSSPSKLEDVVAFYKKEMAASGWTEKEGGMAAEGFAMLNYTKDKRTAQITITADKDTNVTTVLISVEEPK